MDPEDGAKIVPGGNPAVLLHDQGISGLSFSHLPSVQWSPSGDYPSFHSEPVSLHQADMNIAAPDLPTRSVRERKDGEYEAAPKRRNRPLNLLDLPTDILKEILSQVRRYTSLTCRS